MTKHNTDHGPAVFESLDEMLTQVILNSENHIGSMRGYATLIEDDDATGENAARWAGKVVRSVDRLQSYIEQLSMLRIGETLETESVTWNEIISMAARKCAVVNTKAARIEVDAGAGAPFLQYRDLLIRVVYQVLRNACEAVAPGGNVSVNVCERFVPKESGEVREFVVVISDDGCGIDPASNEDVWKPFFTTKHDQMGLGLPFMATAAPILGLKYDVCSSAEEGTTVTLVVGEQGGNCEAQHPHR